MRVPGDNCLSEPHEIDKIIEHHINLKKRSFTSNLTNIFKSGYPDGLGAEVFDYNTLKDIAKKKISKICGSFLSYYNFKIRNSIVF